MDMLESIGEGEITIGQMAFPDSHMQIKDLEKKVSDLTKGLKEPSMQKIITCILIK
ncbi:MULTISPECIES: hypothetical protein [Peribacillus]|uniref:hypothetical protein n=1 Tax=Peribacillus TaxID=2675229 RepID=UPI002040ADAB|nr:MULTISPECIES: hypothetical protein [Peribacillus]MCM3674177.1 hypothetical protein [Peribacillus simplex]MDQ0883235.1 hypothetical protein [Peribacillus sp. V2I11]